MTADRQRDVLVPVGDSATLRRTVTYAVEEAYDAAVEAGEPATIHFVFLARWRVFEAEPENVAAAESLLERVAIWAREDLEDLLGVEHLEDVEDADVDGPEGVDATATAPPLEFETAVLGSEEYVFSPGDFADVIERFATEHGVGRIVVDPEFRPGGSVPLLRSFENELADRGFDVEEAAVTRRTRRSLPFTEIGLPEFLVVFATSLLFYLALGGWHVTDAFELVTGVVSAGVVTVTLARISLKEVPRLGRTVRVLARMALYAPILLWEITKANVVLAYVVLHPALPIDPRIVEFDAAVWGDLPVTSLANSITLTPGTLTIDVSRQHFLVHALIPGAEDDLLEGTLERMVRFVFYGRGAARLASPLERARRGDAEDAEDAQNGEDAGADADAPAADTDGETAPAGPNDDRVENGDDGASDRDGRTDDGGTDPEIGGGG